MTAIEVAMQGRAYGPELSKLHDVLYRRRGKDFRAKAAVVARVVRAQAGCGLAAGCGLRHR